MLLPKDIHPTNSLYFNGAYVLQAVRQCKEVSMMDLFVESRKLRDISMPIFVLTLDWLFLADLVSYNDSGNIVSCS
ncbi:ABC-three component system middle component 6 [Photorhabdus heterorhabditis]|uniref:ABC-three component system middle component 6 n=1 Tax=Photorhabdus heterorhabditis TaxID=880156 RepID=UPI0030DBB2E5